MVRNKNPAVKNYKKLNPCTLVYSLLLESVRALLYHSPSRNSDFGKKQVLAGKTSFLQCIVITRAGRADNNAY